MSTQPQQPAKLWLVAGANPSRRAQAIIDLVTQFEPTTKLTLLLSAELFGSGTVAEQNQCFEFDQALKARGVHVLRMAPGCACCSSKLVLQTQLGRTLRLNPPQALVLELDSGSHVDKVLTWLEEPQWHSWFTPPQVIQTAE